MHYSPNTEEMYLFSPIKVSTPSYPHMDDCLIVSISLMISQFPQHISKLFFLKDVSMKLGGTTRCLRKKFVILNVTFKFVNKFITFIDVLQLKVNHLIKIQWETLAQYLKLNRHLKNV